MSGFDTVPNPAGIGSLLHKAIRSSGVGRVVADPVFTSFDVNFSGMTVDALPTNGAALTAFPSPTVHANMNDNGGGSLSGDEDRTLKMDIADPPEAIAFDAQDFGNGTNIPAEGFRIQIYICSQSIGERFQIACAVGNGKDLHFRQDASTDDGLFFRSEIDLQGQSQGSRGTIEDNVYDVDDVDITYLLHSSWMRYRFKLDGAARTMDLDWKKMAGGTIGSCTQYTIPAGAYPDFRYFCFWPYIQYSDSNFLHSVWVGEHDEPWPSDRTYSS